MAFDSSGPASDGNGNEVGPVSPRHDMFRLMVESAQEGLWAMDRNGITTFVSPRTASFLGYSAEEMIGRHVTEFMAPDEAEDHLQKVRARQTGIHETYERTFLSKSNEPVVFMVSASALADDAGDYDGSIGFIVDITLQKYCEKQRQEMVRALEMKTREFEALLRGSSAVLEGRDFAETARSIFDIAREMTGAKSGYVALLSADGQENELLFLESGGLPCSVDPYLPMPVRGLRAEAYHSGRAVFDNDFMHSPWVGMMPSGHVRLQNVMFAPLNIDGHTVGVMGLANKDADFTQDDVRVAEAFGQLAAIALRNGRNLESLRDRERTYSTLLSNLPGFAYRCDNDSDWTIHYISDGCVEVVGYSPADFMNGRITYNGMIHPDHRGEVWDDWQKAIESRGVYQGEYRVLTIEGRERWVLERGRGVFAENGDLKFLEGFVMDVTDRKQAQEEKEKLQSQLVHVMKMEAVGRLAGGVAHDFNNLLTSIIGSVELAMMDTSMGNRTRHHLEVIGKAADSAASLTRQLLAFSRKQMIEPRIINVNQQLAALHSVLERLIGEDVRLIVTCSLDLWNVRVDPGQFEQVLVNLVVNARDAMPGGGELVIAATNALLDDDYCRTHPDAEPGRFVKISVSDSGTGMSEEVRRHLFEPFFTTKGGGRGTGFGLATIYGAVRQVGGSIDVDSELGRGTAFHVYLPKVDGPADETDRIAGDELRVGRETVLFVEDEDIVREIVVEILKIHGYDVIDAGDPLDAVEVATARKEPIDLLLTDVVMPHMNGRELADRLVVIHPEMKVLYSSGYSENEIVKHGIVDKGLNFIGKPYTPQALAAKLREVLGS